MKYYTFEIRNHKWIFYLGVFQIVLAFVARYFSSITGQSSSINISSAVLDFVWILSFPIGAIVAGIVAYQLNRVALFWGIFGLFFSPIALIILSFKKLYLNLEINLIYRKYETEYFRAIANHRKDLEKGIISTNGFHDKKLISKNEIEIEMNHKIQELNEKIIEDLNKPIKETNLYPTNGETKVAYEKCPACGVEVTNENEECPECGLKLK